MNFEEKIWCVLSEEMSFETFFPIWSLVNENEIKNFPNQKFEISQYTCSVNVCGRDPPYEYYYRPMLTKRNTNRKKYNFEKEQNFSGYMVDR